MESTPNGIKFAIKFVPTWPTMNVVATDLVSLDMWRKGSGGLPRKTANLVLGSLFSARMASRIPAGFQIAIPQILPVQEAGIIPIVAVKLADQGAAKSCPIIWSLGLLE